MLHSKRSRLKTCALRLCLVSALFFGRQSALAVGAQKTQVLDPFGCESSAAMQADLSKCNRDALSQLANRNLHTGSYTFARENMFQFVDVYLNENGVRVVKSVYTPDEFEVGEQGIPQNGVNCEHTYPQSFLKKSARFSIAKSDIFHLFPVDGRENSRRSNMPYANCGVHSTSRGTRCDAGYEPPEQHKGIVARAMFYIATTYGLDIDNAQEQILREWNSSFPVTSAEKMRSQRVTEIQGNINPFIEHPEWANLVNDF